MKESSTYFWQGAWAFLLEPWLILGSVVLWLTVPPLGALLWSGTMLAYKLQALIKGWRAAARAAVGSAIPAAVGPHPGE